MDRYKRHGEIKAHYDGYVAGLLWLVEELYYYNDDDKLICADCGAEFWVPQRMYIALEEGPGGTKKMNKGGWAGERDGGTAGGNMCFGCLEAMMRKVREMEAREKEAATT